MTQLELRNVVHDYTRGKQRVRALDGVTLSIPGRQFVSLIGPSGAGKSTMLHMMGAIDIPSSGDVLLGGRDLRRLDDNELADTRRRKVGFIFQFFNLLPMLSAWENVAVPQLLDGVQLSKVRPRAIELLDRVGLADRAEHRPGELSGGQMQRVAIARSLVMDPAVILADEPTGNLDPDTSWGIVQLLLQINHRGTTVLMATHNREVVDLVRRRVIAIEDGRVIRDEAQGMYLREGEATI